MTIAPITIYQFSDFNIDVFIEKYLYAISEHKIIRHKPTLPLSDLLQLSEITQEQYDDMLEKYNEPTITLHPAKRGVKNCDIIKCKIQYLQDVLIRGAISKKDGVFRLYSQLLKNVIGDEYTTMLDILMDMNYLISGDGKNGMIAKEYKLYSPGDYSWIYSIPEGTNIHKITITNARIQGYLEKATDHITHYYESKVYPNIDSRYGVGFTKNYHKSLRLISIEDEHALNTYIQNTIKRKPTSVHYYNYLVERLKDKNKHIQSIDNAGRIYHILTNADRHVKQYLNILVSADCKNSHPVLFNYYIFEQRKVSTVDAYVISQAMHKIQDGTNIRQALQTEVSNQVLGLLSDDELNYIYLTSTGKLWDEIVEKHPDMDRNDIKVKMFAEVFYSNKQRTYRWQEYATEFRSKFPNVMKSIKYWKSPENAPDIKAYMETHDLNYKDKPTTSLSIAMMNLEAQIFTEILRRVYRKRWKAVHIHDCIIVPKTRGKNQPTKEQIVSIMKDVYSKYGLSPTFA
jgi:hypothetical protein